MNGNLPFLIPSLVLVSLPRFKLVFNIFRMLATAFLCKSLVELRPQSATVHSLNSNTNEAEENIHSFN